MRKAACDLDDGDCIGVSGRYLGKSDNQYYRVPVIQVRYLGGSRVAVHTPGGVIECAGVRMFDLVESLEMHTDELTPQFPKRQKQQSRRGRTVE